LFKVFLNIPNEAVSRTSESRLFHDLTVDGKKDFLNLSVRVGNKEKLLADLKILPDRCITVRGKTLRKYKGVELLTILKNKISL
jgi:hypothetical protein